MRLFRRMSVRPLIGLRNGLLDAKKTVFYAFGKRRAAALSSVEDISAT